MSAMLQGLMLFVGLSGGILTAGGLFAFLVMIGAVTRLAAGTKTAKYVMLYEDMALFGATIGNIAYLYGTGIRLGNLWLLLYGLGAGVFTGCLAAALAEVIKMLPVVSERLNMKKGMTAVMIAFALGKMAGAWLDLIGF